MDQTVISRHYSPGGMVTFQASPSTRRVYDQEEKATRSLTFTAQIENEIFRISPQSMMTESQKFRQIIERHHYPAPLEPLIELEDVSAAEFNALLDFFNEG
jgi:hypothetical protein